MANTDDATLITSAQRLRAILETMDVPERRKSDVKWLGRNLGIRNHDHEDYQEALDLMRIVDPMAFIIGREDSQINQKDHRKTHAAPLAPFADRAKIPELITQLTDEILLLDVTDDQRRVLDSEVRYLSWLVGIFG